MSRKTPGEGLQKKYNYLSELRSCEKRVEEGGREETAGGRWGGGRERKEGEKLQMRDEL